MWELYNFFIKLCKPWVGASLYIYTDKILGR